MVAPAPPRRLRRRRLPRLAAVAAEVAKSDPGTAHLGAAVPPLALTLLVLGAYWRFVNAYFQGGDTWPHIWTTRANSLSDVMRVLSEPIMSGTVFPETIALFFRPISSLSYALNYAVSGMNPVAFHLTDVLIHLVATLALCVLASILGLRPWAAAIGAATFALHPVMASVVPNLPRRHDTLAAAGVFVALALTAWVVKQPRQSPGASLATVLSALALGFAELSKEVGYLGLVLAVPTAFAAAISAGGRLRDHLGRIATLLFALGLITALLIAWRWLVLGGLGGYYDRTPPFSNLDVALNDVLENLLFPFYALLGRTPRAWLTEIGLAAVISGAAALLGGRRTRTVIVYGWIWLVVCALFQVLTKSLAAWHTYLTVAGFAFLAGGVLDGAFDVWRSPAKPWPSKGVLAASVAGVLWFEVALLQSSVITRPFDEWRIAGEVARGYLLSLRPCLESAPPGVRIVVANAPEQLEVTTPERRLIHAGILGPYSVEPAVHLVMPDLSDRRLTARNLVELSAQPTSMTTRCRIEDGIWLITTDFTM